MRTYFRGTDDLRSSGGLCSEKARFDLGRTLLRATHVCSSVDPAYGKFSCFVMVIGGGEEPLLSRGLVAWKQRYNEDCIERKMVE